MNVDNLRVFESIAESLGVAVVNQQDTGAFKERGDALIYPRGILDAWGVTPLNAVDLPEIWDLLERGKVREARAKIESAMAAKFHPVADLTAHTRGAIFYPAANEMEGLRVHMYYSDRKAEVPLFFARLAARRSSHPRPVIVGGDYMRPQDRLFINWLAARAPFARALWQRYIAQAREVFEKEQKKLRNLPRTHPAHPDNRN